MRRTATWAPAAWLDRCVAGVALLTILGAALMYDPAGQPNPFEPTKAGLIRRMAEIAAALMVLRQVAKPLDFNRLRHPAVLGLAGVLLSAIIATASSSRAWDAWLGSDNRQEGLRTWLALVVVVVALVLVEIDGLPRLLARTLAISGALVAIYGIFEHFGYVPVFKDTANTDLALYVYHPGRIAATIGNPDFLGSYLVLTMPLTFAFFRRSIGLPLLALQSVALLFCGARAPYVGFAAGVVALLFYYRHATAAKVALIGGAALVFALVSLRPATAVVRAYVWRDAIVGWAQQPVLQMLLGVGPDMQGSVITPALSEYVKAAEGRAVTIMDTNGPSHYKVIYDRAHNEAIDFLITQGALGLLAYGGLVTGVLAAAFRSNAAVWIFVLTSHFADAQLTVDAISVLFSAVIVIACLATTQVRKAAHA